VQKKRIMSKTVLIEGNVRVLKRSPKPGFGLWKRRNARIVTTTGLNVEEGIVVWHLELIAAHRTDVFSLDSSTFVNKYEIHGEECILITVFDDDDDDELVNEDIVLIPGDGGFDTIRAWQKTIAASIFAAVEYALGNRDVREHIIMKSLSNMLSGKKTLDACQIERIKYLMVALHAAYAKEGDSNRTPSPVERLANMLIAKAEKASTTQSPAAATEALFPNSLLHELASLPGSELKEEELQLPGPDAACIRETQHRLEDMGVPPELAREASEESEGDMVTAIGQIMTGGFYRAGFHLDNMPQRELEMPSPSEHDGRAASLAAGMAASPMPPSLISDIGKSVYARAFNRMETGELSVPDSVVPLFTPGELATINRARLTRGQTEIASLTGSLMEDEDPPLPPLELVRAISDTMEA